MAHLTITYVLNSRSGVLHKLVDGRAHESCNTDQIRDKQRLTAEPWEVKRYCKRCWEWE